MDKERKVEVYNIDLKKWVEVDFEQLKTGDAFRFFDNGERFADRDGNNVWIASGNPRLNDDGIWMIETIF